jgi:hypothetical protein
MVPPERRLDRVLRLVEEGKYFTLHAGRQTGKTTCAQWMVKHLNASGRYRAVWVDLETAREQPDPALAFRTILGELDDTLSVHNKDMARPSRADIEEMLRDPSRALKVYLGQLSEGDPRPLVILFDESDGLVGPTMVSFLTQLRRGYLDRAEAPFPSSVALVGLRQVRDYVLSADDRRAVAWLGTTSPFNISAEASTLASFSPVDVEDLLAQHTASTGQRFAAEAVARIYELGQGHPWLTNALADQIVNRDVEDRSVAVTAAHVETAKETIILERRSHIDSLAAKLREPRVQRIVEPMLLGEPLAPDVLDDDLAYVLGLGLVTTRRGLAEIANPIYREVIPRALTYVRQVSIAEQPAWYVRANGSLDLPKLMATFQTFWRKDGHLAAAGFGYREAGPHLLLMAFLQRIVNGGGRIEREYGLGRGALDVMIFWKGEERHAVEVKLRRDTETEAEALAQVVRYLDGAGLAEGWLVLFDLRASIPWSEKLTMRTEAVGGKEVHVVGC